MSATVLRRSEQVSGKAKEAADVAIELEHIVARIQSLNHLMEGSRELAELRQAGDSLKKAYAVASPNELIVMFKNIASIADMSGALTRQYHRESLEHLVRAITPASPVASNELKKHLMVVQARNALLKSGDWVTAADIAELGNYSKSNASAQPNKWKKAGQIFAVPFSSQDYFPLFALDPASYRPRKVIATIIEKFGAAKDSWGLAYWFSSVNGYLGGKRPQDLLSENPEALLAAVDRELGEVAHG